MKKIYQSSGWMADTPAAIDRRAGILYINPELYNKLTPFQRAFVKEHEMGHYELDTDNELLADEYAFKKIAGTVPYSLQSSIETLEAILDEDNNIGHKIRIDHMYQLAQQWDEDHPEHINKASGADEAAKDDAYVNMILAGNAGNVKTMQSATNAMQNMLNTILITAVIIVAMVFVLKED